MSEHPDHQNTCFADEPTGPQPPSETISAMTRTEWAQHEVADVRIALAHGVVQLLCNLSGVDALHIKGFALDPALRHNGRTTSDLDLLVRPAHVEVLRAVLPDHGWSQYGRFATGSPFGHGENWHHDVLGYLDLHRFIPGIGLSPDESFDRLWASRTATGLAQVVCAVPSIDAQALVLLLHAARSHGDQRAALDVDHVWRNGSPASRARIADLVATLRADVAFAAAIGTLEDFRDRPDYLLWKVSSSPEASRTKEWWARIRAASGPREKLALAFRSVMVNRDHLRATRGHEPTRAEMVREFLSRAKSAAHEVVSRRSRP